MRPEKKHEMDKEKGKIIKWIYRVVGYKIAVYLSTTDINPNSITLFRFICAIFAAILIANQNLRIQIIGILLLQLFSVLDKTDGGVARIKGMETDLGAWLDSNFDVMGIVLAHISLWYCVHNESFIFALCTMITIFLFVFIKFGHERRSIFFRNESIEFGIAEKILTKNISKKKISTYIIKIYKFIIDQCSMNGRSVIVIISLGVICSIEKSTIIILFIQASITWLHSFTTTTVRIFQNNN